MTRALCRVLFLAYITIHHVSALSASGDEITRKISTPAEFVEALTDTTVARILITVSEIVIWDADFLKHGTIELQRNVTVQGDGALPDYPYLRLLAFKKIKIGARVVLTFDRVSIYTPYSDNITRAPSWRILERSDPGSQARLLASNFIFFSESCNPLPGRVDNLGQLAELVAAAQATGQLPADIPISITPRVNQTGCVDINSSEASAYPMARRCWPDVVAFESMVASGQEINSAGAPEATNYIWVVQNLTSPCLRLADDKCLDAYGPVGCNAWAISNIPPAPIFTMSPNRSGLDASAQESGDGGNDTVAIALACALGGAALLTLLTAGVVCWRSARRWRRNGLGGDMASKLESRQLAAVDAVPNKKSAGGLAVVFSFTLCTAVSERTTAKGAAAAAVAAAAGGSQAGAVGSFTEECIECTDASGWTAGARESTADGCLLKDEDTSGICTASRQTSLQPRVSPNGSEAAPLLLAGPVLPTSPFRPDLDLNLSINAGVAVTAAGGAVLGTEPEVATTATAVAVPPPAVAAAAVAADVAVVMMPPQQQMAALLPGARQANAVAVGAPQVPQLQLLQARRHSPPGDISSSSFGPADPAAATPADVEVLRSDHRACGMVTCSHTPAQAQLLSSAGRAAAVEPVSYVSSIRHAAGLGRGVEGGTGGTGDGKQDDGHHKFPAKDAMNTAAAGDVSGSGCAVVAAGAHRTSVPLGLETLGVGPSTAATMHPVAGSGGVSTAGLHGSAGGTAHVSGGLPECSISRSLRNMAAAAYVSTDNTLHLLPVVRGCGGFGRVYEGVYQGQKVAVKMLVRDGEGAAAGNTAALVTALQQEINVLGRCSHPNVVRLIAACLDPRQPCLVMELCGTSLEALIYNRRCGEGGGGNEAAAQSPLMPLDQVLNVALGICSALSYLHPTITHRDLKPANVLLNDAHSDAPEVKLADFGLARIRATTMPTLEPEAGTTAYIAPECFDVTNTIITHHADLYSLGVCIWAMLTGEQPWRDFSIVAIAFKVCVRSERLPLDRIPRSCCPPRLLQLVKLLFDADPRRRPAAEEVAKELMLVKQQLLRQQKA